MTQTNVRSIASLIIVFSRSPSFGAGAESGLELEVQDIAATLSGQTTSTVTVYELHFDLKVTNKSARPVRIPKAVSAFGVTTVFVSAIERQQTDGDWTFLSQSSFYGTNRMKYTDCSPLAPGKSAEIRVSNYVLPLPRVTARELGNEPTLRASVMLFCKATGGFKYTSGTTAPFELTLPTVDQ